MWLNRTVTKRPVWTWPSSRLPASCLYPKSWCVEAAGSIPPPLAHGTEDAASRATIVCHTLCVTLLQYRTTCKELKHTEKLQSVFSHVSVLFVSHHASARFYTPPILLLLFVSFLLFNLISPSQALLPPGFTMRSEWSDYKWTALSACVPTWHQHASPVTTCDQISLPHSTCK